MNDQELKKQYMQLRSYDEKMRDIEKEIIRIEEQLNHVEEIKIWLDEINLNKNKDALIPLIDGIFIKAKLLDDSDFVVNVGSQVMVPKSKDETVSMLESQKSELLAYKENLVENLSYLDTQAQILEKEFIKNSGQNV